jgi:seryl-tRNA synthetase
MQQNETELDIATKITIPPFMMSEVLSKLAYVDELILSASIRPDGSQITLKLAGSPDAAKSHEIEVKANSVVDLMVKNARPPHIQILEDVLDHSTLYSDDPMPTLIQSGEVMQEATGLLLLGPMMSNLIDFFEQKFLSLAAEFNAKPYRFPTLIPAKYLNRVNYFKSFPHYLTFATHLREDFDVINAFAETASCDEHGLVAPDNSFSPIQALLSPAVCYHLYFFLADKQLPNDHLVATAVGNCFRYESTRLTSLERLWNFSMREVIFVGSQDYVLENREKARIIMRKFFTDLGMAYRVESANDPFFVGEFRKQALFQSAFQLKYEIRASLPFKSSTLAIGSYNFHQDFFGRHLNITLADGSPANTGCVAFGLERCAYAFLAQYGFDQSKWPDFIRNFLK